MLADPKSKQETGVSSDGVVLTLAVRSRADVDAWAQKLQARGVVLEKPPTFNERYNIYHIFFRDPDQHLCEVQAFLDPSWPNPPKRAVTILRQAGVLLAAATFGALVGRRCL